MDEAAEAGIQVYAKWVNGIEDDAVWMISGVIRAADAARAVGDEEVVEIMARAAFDQEYWNETDASRDRMWAKNNHTGNRWRERAKAGITALRAAGLKVVRG